MPAGVYEGALEDPATRKWCERQRKRAKSLFVVSAVMSLPGWLVVFFVLDRSGLVRASFWVDVPFFVLTWGLVLYADLRLGRVKRYLRILQVYPWQQHKAALFVAGNGVPYLRVADPENPARLVSVRIRRPGVRRWRGLARAGSPQSVWFAGDPRIGGAVARPGPRGLVLARQGGAPGRADAVNAARDGGTLNDVSEEALARARAAGFGSDAQFAGLLQR